MKDKFIRLINDVIIVMAERMNETCYILEANDTELTSASGMNQQDISLNHNALTEDMLTQSRQENATLKDSHFRLETKYKETVDMLAKAEAMILDLREEIDEKDREILRLRGELKTSEEERILLQSKVTELANLSRQQSRQQSRDRLQDTASSRSSREDSPVVSKVIEAKAPDTDGSLTGSYLSNQTVITNPSLKSPFPEGQISITPNGQKTLAKKNNPEMVGRGFNSTTGAVKVIHANTYSTALPHADFGTKIGGSQRRPSVDNLVSQTTPSPASTLKRSLNRRSRSTDKAPATTKSTPKTCVESASMDAPSTATASSDSTAKTSTLGTSVQNSPVSGISGKKNSSTLIKEKRSTSPHKKDQTQRDLVLQNSNINQPSTPAESKITVNVKATQASVQLAKLMSAYKSRNAQNIKHEMKNVSVEVSDFIRFFKRNISTDKNENCQKFLQDLENSLEELAVNIFSKDSTMLVKNDLFVKHCYSIANCMKKLVVEVENMPLDKLMAQRKEEE